jgi:hypothetical protein
VVFWLTIGGRTKDEYTYSTDNITHFWEELMKSGNPDKGKPSGVTRAGAEQYAISPGLVKWIFFSPFLIVLVLSILSTPPFLDLHPYLWGENKLVESFQFPIFALAGVMGVITAWHMLKQMERPYIWLTYGVFALVMTFIAMEEIAWGQQLFGFKAPDFIRRFNVQNEFTFHNVSLLQDRTDFLNLGFALAGGLGLWLTVKRKHTLVGVPMILTPWMSLILVLSLIGIWVDLFVEVRPVNYSIHIQTESAELLIAITGVFYPWLNVRAFVPRAPGSTRLDRAVVMDGKLYLTTRDGREIVIPTAQVPMLIGVESKKAVDLEVIQDGTYLRGIDPREVLHVRSLLKTSPDLETLTRMGPFPLPKVYGWVALLAGITSMVWLVLIPSDSKNAWVLGLSKTRLVLFLFGVGLLVLICYFLFKSAGNSDRRFKKARRLNTFMMRPALLRWVGLFSGLVVFAALFLLLASYLMVDPYLRGILIRIAPWFFWSLVLFCEIFVLVNSSLLTYARLSMERTEEVWFQGSRMVVRLQRDRVVRVPLSHFPVLEEAEDRKRDEVNHIGDGLRLMWPSLKVDICVEGLLAGVW